VSSLSDLVPFVLSESRKSRDLDRKSAMLQHQELLEVLPSRLKYIEDVLARDGISRSGDDREYMSTVGEWLVLRSALTDVRQLMPESQRGADPALHIDLYTISACHYIGYLFAWLLITRFEGLDFELCVDSKRNAYYQQTILRSRSLGDEFEPVSLLMNFVRGRLDTSRPLRDLGELFDRWIHILRS